MSKVGWCSSGELVDVESLYAKFEICKFDNQKYIQVMVMMDEQVDVWS